MYDKYLVDNRLIEAISEGCETLNNISKKHFAYFHQTRNELLGGHCNGTIAVRNINTTDFSKHGEWHHQCFCMSDNTFNHTVFGALLPIPHLKGVGLRNSGPCPSERLN